MKPEEAIEYLRDPINKSLEQHDEGVNLSIEALEKQVAKKPERLNAFRSIGKCGGCERVISERTASVYCQYCGNKVDWGNEE